MLIVIIAIIFWKKPFLYRKECTHALQKSWHCKHNVFPHICSVCSKILCFWVCALYSSLKLLELSYLVFAYVPVYKQIDYFILMLWSESQSWLDGQAEDRQHCLKVCNEIIHNELTVWDCTTFECICNTHAYNGRKLLHDFDNSIYRVDLAVRQKIFCYNYRYVILCRC